jgi:hypothetical protein
MPFPPVFWPMASGSDRQGLSNPWVRFFPPERSAVVLADRPWLWKKGPSIVSVVTETNQQIGGG